MLRDAHSVGPVLAIEPQSRIHSSEDDMTKTTQSLWMLGALALALCTAPLFAQSDSQSSTSPSSQSQQQAPDQAQPSQPPAGQSGSNAQGQQSADEGQTFSGTIAKTGDKYVLQDTSGKTYDVDHQEALKQYEGKKVRIKGTLDPDGQTLHIKKAIPSHEQGRDRTAVPFSFALLKSPVARRDCQAMLAIPSQ